MINSAYVKIWANVVGAVAWDETEGLASFEYDSKFADNGWDIAPLKMPLEANRVFSFPGLRKSKNSENDTFKGLPGLLADVLPDKYGTRLINAWLVQNGRTENSMNPVEQLCFIGTRGMGALEFEPSTFTTDMKPENIELSSLVEIAQHILNDKKNFKTNLKKNYEKGLKEILKIGTSAGGARPKAIIAFNEKTGRVKSGQTYVDKGYEHWLIKLDGVSDEQFGVSQGYGRVEMAYYNMAKDCEINIMQSKLIEESGRAHFMTKRFDRDGNTKHHVQTLCALQHYDYNDLNSYSYEQLFQTMRILKLSYPQAEQMYRRIVFNVLARNCDDHTKNFSFLLKKDQKWELAPAYDLCHAYRPDSVWVSRHVLSINGKKENITMNDLLKLAESVNVKKPKTIITQINEIIQKWPHYAEEVKVNSKIIDSIRNTLIKMV